MAETHTPAKEAVIGAQFAVTDQWRCQCGREHRFGAYAAGHWDFELTHTCGCGAGHTFKAGEVIA